MTSAAGMPGGCVVCGRSLSPHTKRSRGPHFIVGIGLGGAPPPCCSPGNVAPSGVPFPIELAVGELMLCRWTRLAPSGDARRSRVRSNTQVGGIVALRNGDRFSPSDRPWLSGFCRVTFLCATPEGCVCKFELKAKPRGVSPPWQGAFLLSLSLPRRFCSQAMESDVRDVAVARGPGCGRSLHGGKQSEQPGRGAAVPLCEGSQHYMQ